jgi:hypothetical protein
MSRNRLPPPQPRSYLEGRYPSTQKGGTLIAEDVTDLETHERRLCDPNGYRPPVCLRCGHGVLHVHDYRGRVLRADPAQARTTVVRHRCALASCGARWLILPLLLARHLWRRWEVVEASALGRRPAHWPTVPARTRRRWRARLQMAGRLPVQVLAASGSAVLERVSEKVGLAATRLEVVLALGLPLAEAAALVHRLAPGLRLM